MDVKPLHIKKAPFLICVTPAGMTRCPLTFLSHLIKTPSFISIAELCCLGLDRGNPSGAKSPVLIENTRIRIAMQQKEPNEKLQKLIDYVMLQISQYRQHGFKIIAIIGANRSPNCEIETTSENNQ